MMTTPRIVALLLVANTIVVVAGILSGGGSRGIERPSWLPSIPVRTGIPLAVAVGLWFGQQWAWWAAVTMCAGLLLWIGIASFVLALGGYFSGEGAAVKVVHFSLLVVTWLAGLGVLLSASGRISGGL